MVWCNSRGYPIRDLAYPSLEVVTFFVDFPTKGKALVLAPLVLRGFVIYPLATALVSTRSAPPSPLPVGFAKRTKRSVVVVVLLVRKKEIHLCKLVCRHT